MGSYPKPPSPAGSRPITPAPFAAHDGLVAARDHQCTGGDERRASTLVRDVSQLSQDQSRVGAVVSVSTRPPRGQHTGHTVECVDLDTGIVCDAGHSGCSCSVTRFGERILLERRSGLGGFGERRDLVEPDQFDSAHSSGVEHPVKFLQFLGISAGNQYSYAHSSGTELLLGFRILRFG